MRYGPRLVFRTEGDGHSGFGHVRRCLSLAETLQHLGSNCLFLVSGDATIMKVITAAGFDVFHLGTDGDLAETYGHCLTYQPHVIVADSYTFQQEHFSRLAATGAFVVAIDDVAERELPVDLVVNGSVGAERLFYRGGAPTKFLLGPRYALLRNAFAEEPKRFIADRIHRVLITLGGSDRTDLTPRLIRWVRNTLDSVELDVVVGPLFRNQHAVELEARRCTSQVMIRQEPGDIRGLMMGCDLALCGGGQTTYELAATGTPAIAVRMAENQTVNLKGLAEAGTLIWAGDALGIDLEENVTQTIIQLSVDKAQRVVMSGRGRKLVDGRGSQRIAQVIVKQIGLLKR